MKTERQASEVCRGEREVMGKMRQWEDLEEGEKSETKRLHNTVRFLSGPVTEGRGGGLRGELRLKIPPLPQDSD